MEGSCFAPIGCWARVEKHAFLITAYSASKDTSQRCQKTVQGKIFDFEKLALILADKMIQNGARELMAI